MQIKDLNIIITGAGAGFGKAMSIAFANQNANIYALDINKNSLTQLKNEYPAIHINQLNVTNYIQIEEKLKTLFEKINSPTVLINNAGIMKNAPLINFLNKDEKKHSVDLWKQVIDTNQSSIFYMTRAFAELMINKRLKGLIINISSIAAQGNIGQTAYSASKAAVEAMTKVWAKELGRFNIRSVAIAPGFIDTVGTYDAIEEKMLNQWIEKTPLRRTGSIDEVVKSIQFVIENDFINGETINVNGGLTL